ncbi:MAG: BrnT family toxin [Vicinamibacterales bacterium]
MAYNFEWDPKKAASNLKDHDVSFDEATSVFGDILSMNMPDPDHSEGEQRFLVLGVSAASRLVVVSYAERPPRTRIINARLATKRERRKYENE